MSLRKPLECRLNVRVLKLYLNEEVCLGINRSDYLKEMASLKHELVIVVYDNIR
jgi:hypothetical protein